MTVHKCVWCASLGRNKILVLHPTGRGYVCPYRGCFYDDKNIFFENERVKKSQKTGRIKPKSLREDIIVAKALMDFYIKWKNYSRILIWGNYLERLVKRIRVPSEDE